MIRVSSQYKQLAILAEWNYLEYTGENEVMVNTQMNVPFSKKPNPENFAKICKVDFIHLTTQTLVYV